MFGRRSSGSFDIRKLDGARLNAGVSYKKLKFLEAKKTVFNRNEVARNLRIVRMAIPPTAEDVGFLA